MPASSSLSVRPVPGVELVLARPAVSAVWGLAAWLAVVGNLPLWLKLMALDQSLSQRWVLVTLLGLMVVGGTAALLSLLHWPRLFRPLASLLALVTAFNSYFMWQYHTVIDSTMLANVVHTDAHEVRELLSWRLVLSVLLIAGPALWWIWRRPLDRRPLLSRVSRNTLGAAAGLALVVVAMLSGYQNLSALMRNQKPLRYMVNPLNSVYATGVLVAQQVPHQARALGPTGEDAQLGASYTGQTRTPLLMLVVGETARAKNWQLNGYPRPTTPRLAQWQAQGDLVNFSHVTACGTNTLVSLPCMFSPLTRAQGGNQPAQMENLLDVLQRAGLAVLWVDNQSGCKGVCDRVPNVNTRHPPVAGSCADAECDDTALLDGLDARIATLDPQRRARGVVLVMHQMGSHGPAYFKRRSTEPKPFLPECGSATLTDCAPETIVNAYNNTLVQTDALLDQALHWLQARATSGANDTGLIYVSDHGESLGENGLYLHGLPYALAPEEQTQVPMVAWMSPGLQSRTGTTAACLRERADQAFSHDNLFHTVLGVMDVHTRVYQSELDITAPCVPAR